MINEHGDMVSASFQMMSSSNITYADDVGYIVDIITDGGNWLTIYDASSARVLSRIEHLNSVPY